MPNPQRLTDLLNHWVTVTNPHNPTSWSGRLTGLRDHPCLTLDLGGGHSTCLPQSFRVEEAEPPDAVVAEVVADDQQHAQAVMRVESSGPRTTPDNPATSSDTADNPAVLQLAEAIRLTREYVGTRLLPAVAGWDWYDALRKWAPDYLDAMLAAEADNARTAPDNPAAEDLNSVPPNTSGLDICELPHQTIGEEDDCHRRRDAASDDGLRLALARIASERAHHEHCASLARTGEGGIAHSSIAAGLQIAEAHLRAALDGPADTTPSAEGQPDAPRCPRCGDSLADYADDDLVYQVGDQRPYCSGECVVRAHREALKEQGGPDTCRPVQVDGETIRVHGNRPLTGLELGYAAEIVAAARRKFAAEPPVVRADDGTESALTRRIRARQRGLTLPAVELPDDSAPPVPCPACTRARSRGFTVDALAHPACADALAGREAGR